MLIVEHYPRHHCNLLRIRKSRECQFSTMFASKSFSFTDEDVFCRYPHSCLNDDYRYYFSMVGYCKLFSNLNIFNFLMRMHKTNNYLSDTANFPRIKCFKVTQFTYQKDFYLTTICDLICNVFMCWIKVQYWLLEGSNYITKFNSLLRIISIVISL